MLYLTPLCCSSDQFCVCALSPSIKQAVKHETLTQCQAIVGPLSTTLLKPTFAQYWVTVSCLTPHGMWASVPDGGPTLNQPWFFYLNRHKSLKNRQKTTTTHTGTLEWGTQQVLVLTNAGPLSTTLAQNYLNIVSTSSVCWV